MPEPVSDRVNTRIGELSVRTALGASRGNILRQMLLEALALSLSAGVLGTGLALSFYR